MKVVNSGLASEYYVAAQLSRLGWLVSMTFGNAKAVDLQAFHPVYKRRITVDSKGTWKSNWPMGKAPKIKDLNHFYILLAYRSYKKFLNVSFTPEVYVIPSTKISRLLKSSFRRTTRCIDYKDIKNDKQYKDRWDLLCGGKDE